MWSADDVLVSRDDGASFARLAADPTASAAATPNRAAAPPATSTTALSLLEPGAQVAASGIARASSSASSRVAVAVTSDETVAVIRADRLELELRDGTRLERALPGAGFEQILASGRWLVAWSRDLIATSGDAGATWKVWPTPSVMSGVAVFVDDAGLLHLAAAPGRDALVTYSIATPGGGWRTVWTSPPHRAWADPLGDPWHSSIDAFAFGSDGTLYAQRYDAHGYQTFAVSDDGAVTTSQLLTARVALPGASIAGPAGRRGARDAHGLLLTVGRAGPVRIADNLDLLMGSAGGLRGRWLVGSVVP